MTSETLVKEFFQYRSRTSDICKPLAPNLYTVQPADFVSPPKWHLGHTTWFFEEFILIPLDKEHIPFNENYRVIFNSYYKSQGQHWAREKRGQIERPSTAEVLDYRAIIDSKILGLISKNSSPDLYNRIVLGIHHEQQHQELLLMDIKYILSQIPGAPAYQQNSNFGHPTHVPLIFVPQDGGLIEVGANSGDPFCFDNETPRFKHFQYPFALANRPVTNGEFLEFILDGGYSEPLLWKSDGWDHIQSNKISAPLYWKLIDSTWFEFTLEGQRPIDIHSPVCHLSYYEADAFAEWHGSRLPTEFELEMVLQNENPSDFGFFDSGRTHPKLTPKSSNGFVNLSGHLWEWTASAYLPYPGYRRPKGAFGEYNQKFMINQMVLKGGSLATTRSHFRPSYRNFFYPSQRWAFTGCRLARDGQ